MFAVNVEHFFGKTAARLQSKNTQGPQRIHQHAHRSDSEIVAVKPPQRIRHRRQQVRATANWFGDENFWPAVGSEMLCGLDQRIEPATKTAAGDFFSREAARAEHRRIDKIASLVVGDEANPHALAG